MLFKVQEPALSHIEGFNVQSPELARPYGHLRNRKICESIDEKSDSCFCHSGACRNPGAFHFRTEKRTWMPAFAGMTIFILCEAE